MASEKLISFAFVPLPSSTSNKPTSNSIIETTRPAFNGVAFGSFSSGAFNLNWKDTKDETEFTFETQISSVIKDNQVYAAIGFSYDQKMVIYKLENVFMIILFLNSNYNLREMMVLFIVNHHHLEQRLLKLITPKIKAQNY